MGIGNGTVIPHTPIAVDIWRHKLLPPQARLFFCSHCHADHTDGLTSTWNMPIHCSAVTGKLLSHRLQIKKSLIHPLEIGRSHSIPLDHRGTAYVNVTLINANHCPGAVMFLFEGYFGTILYTADFRLCQATMFDSPPLSERKPIDVLYLDNTYCDPRCVFPTKEEATELIQNIIRDHLYREENLQVLIGMRTLGKEDLLETLALAFSTYIVVDPSTMAQLEVLERRNVFTTNPDKGWIHVKSVHKLTPKLVQRANEEHPTIAILPTALYTGLGGEPYVNNSRMFLVPYSDHSSYNELITFAKFLRPLKVVPIVNKQQRGPMGCDVSERANMACFKPYLSSEPLREVVVPAEVQRMMDGGRTHPLWSPPSTCITALNKQKIQYRQRRQQQKKQRSIPKGVHYFPDEQTEENAGSGTEKKAPKREESKDIYTFDITDTTDSDHGMNEECRSDKCMPPKRKKAKVESHNASDSVHNQSKPARENLVVNCPKTEVKDQDNTEDNECKVDFKEKSENATDSVSTTCTSNNQCKGYSLKDCKVDCIEKEEHVPNSTSNTSNSQCKGYSLKDCKVDFKGKRENVPNSTSNTSNSQCKGSSSEENCSLERSVLSARKKNRTVETADYVSPSGMNRASKGIVNNSGKESQSQPIESQSQAIESRSQAIKAESQAIKSQSQAVESQSQPIKSHSPPIEAQPQAIKSESQAIESESQSQPIKAHSQPIEATIVLNETYSESECKKSELSVEERINAPPQPLPAPPQPPEFTIINTPDRQGLTADETEDCCDWFGRGFEKAMKTENENKKCMARKKVTKIVKGIKIELKTERRCEKTTKTAKEYRKCITTEKEIKKELKTEKVMDTGKYKKDDVIVLYDGGKYKKEKVILIYDTGKDKRKEDVLTCNTVKDKAEEDVVICNTGKNKNEHQNRELAINLAQQTQQMTEDNVKPMSDKGKGIGLLGESQPVSTPCGSSVVQFKKPRPYSVKPKLYKFGKRSVNVIPIKKH